VKTKKKKQEPISGARILKAHKSFTQQFTEVTEKYKPAIAQDYIDFVVCYALFEYLTVGLEKKKL